MARYPVRILSALCLILCLAAPAHAEVIVVGGDRGSWDDVLFMDLLRGTPVVLFEDFGAAGATDDTLTAVLQQASTFVLIDGGMADLPILWSGRFALDPKGGSFEIRQPGTYDIVYQEGPKKDDAYLIIERSGKEIANTERTQHPEKSPRRFTGRQSVLLDRGLYFAECRVPPGSSFVLVNTRERSRYERIVAERMKKPLSLGFVFHGSSADLILPKQARDRNYRLTVVLKKEQEDPSPSISGSRREVLPGTDTGSVIVDNLSWTPRFEPKTDKGRKRASREITLAAGRHHIALTGDLKDRAEKIVLAPVRREREGPENKTTTDLLFRRLNPSKFLLRFTCREPFWLVFNEGFSTGWGLYRKASGDTDVLEAQGGTPVTAYLAGRVRRAAAASRHSWRDAFYLRERPLSIPHFRVNGYANGWWVDPAQSGLGTERELVLFFHPQALIECGNLIAAAGLIAAALYGLFLLILRYGRSKKA
ncbi:MAG: hypothetical protein ACM3L6_03640 [Deltaproteobacteria bacterium]